MAEPKFACAAWGFREMTLPEYFAASKKLGIDLVEVNVSPSTPKHLTYEATDAQVEEMVRQAGDAGVKVVALAGGNNFAAPDLDEQIALVKRQIDMTALAGADVLRIFAGWVGASQFTDATFAQISEALQAVGEHAEAAGVKVAVENHGGVTATGAQCLRLLDPVTSPAVGLNYDPANFRHAGEDAMAALLVTCDRINYSHWKDVYYEGDEPEYCAVGEGVIDWQPIVDHLIASGFDGYWAIEYETVEDVERGARDSLAYLKGLL
ncbi:MAG: sugar phosphate isomerase/epimerase [Armatimonadetes bacterium]|nr:sugar phosphate isomerase/epimerase [Armatimonadota bacterium]